MLIQSEFLIDSGNPIVNDSVTVSVSDLSEALQLIFPLETEDANLTVSGISVPISYKYDVSIIFADIISLLQACENSEPAEIFFGSDTFNAIWKVSFHDDIYLEMNWASVVGDTESELNKIKGISVPRNHFIQQWSTLIKECLHAVKKTNIHIENNEDLLDAERILKALSASQGPSQ